MSLVSKGTEPSSPGQDQGLEEGAVCSSYLVPVAYVSTYLPVLPAYLPVLPTYLPYHLSVLPALSTSTPVLPTYLSGLTTCPTTYLSVSYLI